MPGSREQGGSIQVDKQNSNQKESPGSGPPRASETTGLPCPAPLYPGARPPPGQCLPRSPGHMWGVGGSAHPLFWGAASWAHSES